MSETTVTPARPANDPLAEPIRTRADAEAFIAKICFKIGPPRLAGIELERLIHDATDPTRTLTSERLASALGRWSPPILTTPSADPTALGRPLPAGSTVTVEPGGQVELSTRAWGTFADCLAAAGTDADAVRAALARSGLAVGRSGIDAHRPAGRLVEKARYAAMERYFDRDGNDAGRLMMGSTASVQLSVDAGTETGEHAFAERWRTLHAVGPALVAAFANSPIYAGAPTGWYSTRQRVWIELDPGRTSAATAGDNDPREAYARAALDARLLCLPNDSDLWDAPAGVTFADWLDGALERPATYADLDYHLSTLFPPVRAKGFLEVRYLDAQAGDDWRVPPSVLWTLLASPGTRDAALAAVEPLGPPTWPGAWARAARTGLTDEALARAASALLTLAIENADAAGLPRAVTRQITAFAERYTFRRRTPADDQLAAAKDASRTHASENHASENHAEDHPEENR
ncbi:ergothioneine biosynthesis glutamate--cysteine ligase EgtA [Cryptosporangium phraense]|uniref:Glutamate--cysteine ligase EgtA n=1 Tax=Cryptosporangium phraense TaxID=2593070 RepID=A0A545AQV4_9ACTN|nr:ergothioneine biosynthesis glutamate--cysteine ligase EgtA [Cryptosporangium phraense]TQS43621.1 ergothioneine biosynthesis glutamate--cysteine ligase EgtA [Cryptosporangium phraense]